MTNTEKAINRTISIDILRIVACFFVVIRHVTDSFTNQINYIDYRIVPIIHSITYTALPIFFIITGWFLLEYKEETYKTFFNKRLKKILIPFLFWSAIYAITLKILNPNSHLNFIKALLNNNIYVHFWYVYYIIGVYLAVPILRKLMNNLSNKDLVYIMCIWFIFSIINPIFKNFGYNINISFIFSGWWGYVILGYALRRVELSKQLYKVSLILLCSTYAIVTIINCSKTLSNLFVKIPLNTEMSIPIFLIVSSVAYICIYSNNRSSESTSINARNIICTVSNLTYSIYLLHNLIILIFNRRKFGISITPTFIYPLFGTLIESVIVFGITFIIVFVLSKIRIVKRVVI